MTILQWAFPVRGKKMHANPEDNALGTLENSLELEASLKLVFEALHFVQTDFTDKVAGDFCGAPIRVRYKSTCTTD